MVQVTVAEAKTQLASLLPQLEALRASLPHQASSGVATIRALRDGPRA